MRASVWLNLIERLRPDILKSYRAALAASVLDRDFLLLGPDAFSA